MPGVHTQIGPWALMLHGNLFAQFLYDSGSEHHSGHQAGSINWAMGMARRPLGEGWFVLRTMMSLEPWTIAGCGYPDQLATGELCQQDSIHDRQHPHELFMELAADYNRPLARSLRWQVYGGLAGEPALGPPAFPHRLSAFPNPIAPISHHWLDSTHITFGVITTGVYGARWKAEASVFNGREPDEKRTDLDLAALDSVAARLTLMPTEHLALQASAGHLRDGEAGVGSLPRQDVNRVTASVIYHRPFRSGGLWATTLAYGMKSGSNNIPTGVIDLTTHAVLLETNVSTDATQTWFGRFEVVGKPAHDFHAEAYATQVFTVAKLQLGYVHHLKALKGLLPGLGTSVSASLVPPLLVPYYDGRILPGFGVFFSLQPENSHVSTRDSTSRVHGAT